MPHFRLLASLGNRLSRVQSTLAFERWKSHPQFADDSSLGRTALLSAMLSSTLGTNMVLCALLSLVRLGAVPAEAMPGPRISDDAMQMALQWTAYVVALCSFHLGEFFATAFFNPSATSADSFMVNHSKTYTAAALTSWTEFCIRAAFFPSRNSPRVFGLGVLFVAGGQLCRTWAMYTCGTSFNHYIQRDRKDDHVLVTRGIYAILRHPSYVGFFYWSVGTQLVLCNPVSAVLYAVAAWTFFRYRIAYEEETLRNHFPEYEAYASRTYVGIPFLSLVLRLDEKDA